MRPEYRNRRSTWVIGMLCNANEMVNTLFKFKIVMYDTGFVADFIYTWFSIDLCAATLSKRRYEFWFHHRSILSIAYCIKDHEVFDDSKWAFDYWFVLMWRQLTYNSYYMLVLVKRSQDTPMVLLWYRVWDRLVLIRGTWICRLH